MCIKVKKEDGKAVQKAENVNMWKINIIKPYCAVCDNSNTIKVITQCQSHNFCPQSVTKSVQRCVYGVLAGGDSRKRRYANIPKPSAEVVFRAIKHFPAG